MRSGEIDFAVLRQPGGVPQRLQDVLAFQTGIILQKIVDAESAPDLADDHASVTRMPRMLALPPIMAETRVMR